MEQENKKKQPEWVEAIAGKEPVRESLDRNGNPDGYLFTGTPQPEKGFHCGYFFYLPAVLREFPALIVEGPAVGEVGPLDRACRIVLEKALFELQAGGFPHMLAGNLGCPVMMPLFPRPEDEENNIFTHALTSKAMSVSGAPLERVDLQLIAMFRHIREKFLHIGMKMNEKFIVKGFSAGGAFAHRFTLLHPQYVLAAVGGGCMHSFTLPLRTYQKETLIWPNGMGNIDEGSDFDYDCYQKVRQFFYMDDQDFNDDVPYDDCYTEEERRQIYRLFGKIGMPDRWKLYQRLIAELGLCNIECRTTHGLGHRPGAECREYITVFLQDVLSKTDSAAAGRESI